MKPAWKIFALPAIVLSAVAMTVGNASGQDLGTLNAQINAIAPRISSATSGNISEAEQVVARLDEAENMFAKVANNPKVDRGSLGSAYSRLEDMLNRVYSYYKQKKEDCITQIQNGQAECEYDQAEKVALQALYPLSWLRFQGAVGLYANQPEQAKRLLASSVDGFTESTLGIADPELIRENLLGRASCERELGKYDKAEYEKAIGDFNQIIKDGQSTRQYKAAKQGLATTYAAMGNRGEAEKLTGELVQGASGGQKQGMEMLHLQNIFMAEAAATDPTKRAAYHKEAVEAMRGKETNDKDWAIVLAAVMKNVKDPIAEFGNSADPFEKYLLASVLFSKKQYPEASKYFVEAARSGKYPKSYKYAADIYMMQKRYDLAEQLANELARQPGNPDAQWASYTRFKLAHVQWEQGGMKDQARMQQWMNAAGDYLKAYPKGQYAYEPRYRLGEIKQRNKQYLAAIQDYALVSGNADYNFRARYGAAECYYLALVEASNTDSKDNKNGKTAQPANTAERDQLRKGAIDNLEAAIKMAPGVERSNPAQRGQLRDLQGRSTYMLVGLLQRQPPVDYNRVALMLNGFETQFPTMKEKFQDVIEWRLQALDNLGRYADLEREVRALTERAKGNTAFVDFMKVLGLDFWKAADRKKARNDLAGAQADAKLTTIAYSYFEDLVRAGKIPTKNLTGTLSIQGKAFIALNDVNRAEAIFNQVVKADPGSPDALAGLARIAQAKKDYRNAVELWTRVESVAAESDDVWYEAKYNVAQIYAAQGNINQACGKLRQTRIEHPNLGTPEMKAQWDTLQKKLCLQQKG